ncbi:unnamed protein product [Darwinula stevensoni]|uniref:Uncharacterized protein n=1 Tax=Darwinula stevensoni TaxID=69355 RepID=A0A7R9A7Z2_9CRUS|nr:unnamed protein product [Darwinula stevensoni]CAG0895761.1 unnamed protein product [Darwinula stevensoni]
MLTSKEKQGMQELLELLPPDDLLSLTRTATGCVVPETVTEAIDAIILATDQPLKLLRRQKITYKLLLTYLLKMGIPFDATGGKVPLIFAILKYWGSDTRDSEADEQLSRGDEEPAAQAVDPIDSGTQHGGEPPDVREFASAFAQWYYDLLNGTVARKLSVLAEQKSPLTLTLHPLEEFGKQHFFDDASMRLRVFDQSDNLVHQEECYGCEQVSACLLNAVVSHNLLMNPNMSPGGIGGAQSPHGLIKVMCCGTLQTSGRVCGIFEQIFGLVRDILAGNSWKIKSTELTMKSQSAPSASSLPQKSQLPSLPSH